MLPGRSSRRALAIYVRSEAAISVIAASVTFAALLLALLRWDSVTLRLCFQFIGCVSAIVTLILFVIRLNDYGSKILFNAEGRIDLAVLSKNPNERLISLLEKIESGAKFLADGDQKFTFEIVHQRTDLTHFVKWSENDKSISDSQSDDLDRRRLYGDWYGARPDAFMLAYNRDHVPFCGSIILPLRQKGAEILERDGACAVTLRSPEIASSNFHHLLIDTWVGDARLQSRQTRKHPPFDDLTAAGYALRVAHLAHFFRLNKIRYIWFEPSNPYLVSVAESLPFAERKGHTGKPRLYSYVISLGAAKALARAAGAVKSGTVSERIHDLVATLGTIKL